MTAPPALVLLWFVAGALVGGLYWLTLRWSVALLASGRSVALAIAVQVVRFAALGAALAAVAIGYGWPALLLSASGLVLSRAAVLRLAGRS